MRVVIALSGGVDSAVAAGLLKEQGFDVIAMTLQLFDCTEQINERSCCGPGGISAARSVAGALDIPHYVIDGKQVFEDQVLHSAWLNYRAGRTPNPCVACNERMKFGLLFDFARKLGAERVASGHHARIDDDGTLWRGVDRAKDQSYFLYALRDEQRARALLPIGALTKEQVRTDARRLGLPVAERSESQDACIAQRGDLAEALRQRFAGKASPGAFVDLAGRVIGEHRGIHRYTVGQRKGLGLALGSRAYVVRIDAAQNQVVVDTDERSLAVTSLEVSDLRWLAMDEVDGEAGVQVRYRQQPQPATVERLSADRALVHFAEPPLGVSPGQVAVFYRADKVIGGGVIERTSADA
ncbi:MAG: tRNA 2-thiouridine(34) synthase MnmA [Deltaproteobacteria bacterium]|nr:tRNA 2-thiouridine(34) synthase MnmA [Deltaproteobacteria bacterium]